MGSQTAGFYGVRYPSHRQLNCYDGRIETLWIRLYPPFFVLLIQQSERELRLLVSLS
jgi:hypothetical protein